MTTRRKYEIRAQGDGEAELTIYGAIGSNWWDEESTDAKSVVAWLKDNAQRPVLVRINSTGGSVSDALAIYNALRTHKAGVRTRIDGIAFSAGGYIAMAGSEVAMPENALLMIHAPWGLADGNAAELRKLADQLDKWAAAMQSGYRRGGKVDAADVEQWLTDGEDHFFTADEAIASGLADLTYPAIDMAAATRGMNVYLPQILKPAASAKPLENEMPENTGTPAAPEQPQAANPNQQPNQEPGRVDVLGAVAKLNADTRRGVEQGATAERKRQREIRDLFAEQPNDRREFQTVLNQCLDNPACDINMARQALIDLYSSGIVPIIDPISQEQDQHGGPWAHTQAPTARLGAKQQTAVRPQPRFRPGMDAGEKFREGAIAALSVRTGLVTEKEFVRAQNDNPFMSYSLVDLCKEQLHALGMSVGGSRESVVKRAIYASAPGYGSDHLPYILENVAEKAVMAGYEAAEETWQDWVKIGTLSDYREASRINLSLFNALDTMLEFQPFTSGKFKDVKETIQAYLRGKRFSITLQAMVNDDTGMLTEVPMQFGEAANRTVGDAVAALLTSGTTATMNEDSVALFDASDHTNFVASGSGAAPSTTTLNTAYGAMAVQTDPNSQPLGIRPRYIIHPAALRMTVQALLSSVEIRNTTGSTIYPTNNPVTSLNLVPIEEYRLDGNNTSGWYLAAARRTIEVAFVGGQSTPTVDRVATSDVPGISWDISLPFGAAVLDWRTLYYNYGA